MVEKGERNIAGLNIAQYSRGGVKSGGLINGNFLSGSRDQVGQPLSLHLHISHHYPCYASQVFLVRRRK